MLNMDPVVRVNVSVGEGVVIPDVMDTGAILTSTAGTGTPLTATTRFAEYSSLAEVLTGVEDSKPAFADTTDVYQAAAKYFGVSPAPAKLVVIFYVTTDGTTETPTSAMLDAIDKGAEFYGVYFSPKSGTSAANINAAQVAIASALISLNKGMLFYGVTGTAAAVTGNDSLMKAMFDEKVRRAIGIACTSDVSDAAGVMGVALGYAHSARERAFALCYKSVRTATANNYTQTDIDTIKGVNGNVYVSRSKSRTGLENGATASGLRFDDVLYLDMIAHDIQTGLYSLIADNPTKLPQNDTTTTLFINEIYRILEEYYNAGALHDAIWHGTEYSWLEEDTVIEHGYLAHAGSFDDQSEADRAARKAVPITILLCLAGSVESVVVNLDVQT